MQFSRWNVRRVNCGLARSCSCSRGAAVGAEPRRRILYCIGAAITRWTMISICAPGRAAGPYSRWRPRENTRWAPGELVDVELQPDRLSGFITRLGDRESDEGTPLTFFFATSRLAGQRLAFTTRQVHGVWFSFEGTIVRGSARSRDQQGYYLLEGRLVMHDVASQTEQARMVSLPLARQYPNG